MRTDRWFTWSNPEGRILETWQPALGPQAIGTADDGTVYVAGGGKLAHLDRSGKVLHRHTISGGLFRRPSSPSITVTAKDVFVVLRSGMGFDVYRLDHDLKSSRKILSGLRGCCGQLDITSDGKVLYVAENTRHQVGRYSRDGKLLSRGGTADRTEASGFGGCCNPMNIRVGPGGALYTTETGPDRVKRYSPDGTFLGVVANLSIGKSCISVPAAANRDGGRVYVGDSQNKVVHVLVKE